MRESEPDGLCPIADKAPTLSDENQVVMDLFRQSQGSAAQVETKEKVYVYLKPVEVEALMRIHGIMKAEQEEFLVRLLILQDISNDLRPSKPKSRKVGSG